MMFMCLALHNCMHVLIKCTPVKNIEYGKTYIIRVL